MAIKRLLMAAILFGQSALFSPSVAHAGMVGAVKNSALSIGNVITAFTKQQLEKSAGLEIKNESGEIVGFLMVPRSSKEALKDYSPERLREMLDKSWKGKNPDPTTQPQKTGFKQVATKVVVDSVVKFPAEAFSFFVALGAMNVYKLIFNYSDNPAVISQFLESQKDPVGQLGFLAFMIANHGTSAALMTMLDTKSNLRTLIPYLGMSAGMMASNIVAEISHFPELAACVADLQTRAKNPQQFDSCQKAYNSWTDALSSKGMEMVPSLLSMMASTALAGFIEQKIVKKLLVSAGWEVVISLAPGSLAVKGARMVYKTSQIGMFLGLDELLHPVFEKPASNITKSAEVKSAENELITKLIEKKKNNWAPSPSDKEVDFDLQLFSFLEKAKAWRAMNMQPVATRHATWEQYMSNFISTYKGSFDFYTQFATQRSKLIAKNNGFPSMLEAQAPLAGVTPKMEAASPGSQPPPALEPLNYPQRVEDRQLKHLIEIREKYLPALQAGKLNKFFKRDTQLLKLRQFLEVLPTEESFSANSFDLYKIGKALDWLNSEVELMNDYPGLGPVYPHTPDYFGDYRDFLGALRREIGNPTPLWQPGMAFLNAYESDPSVSTVLKNIQIPGDVGGIKVLKPTDFFVAQMVMGPDVSRPDKMVSLNRFNGYPAEFLPPRVALKNELKFYKPTTLGLTNGLESSIFNVPMRTEFEATGKVYNFNTLFDILRLNYVDQNIFQGAGGILAWWNKNVETQFLKTWDIFEDKYMENLVKFVELLNDKSDTIWNQGPLANNVIESLKQERKLLLLVAGEVLKDVVFSQDAKALAEQLPANPQAPLALKPEQVKTMLSFGIANTTNMDDKFIKCAVKKDVDDQCRLFQKQTGASVSLLKVLRTTNQFDLAGIVNAVDLGGKRPKMQSIANWQNLKFQNEIEASFKELEELLASYKISDLKSTKVSYTFEDFNARQEEIQVSRKVVTSKTKNKDLEAVATKIEKQIASLKELTEKSGRALSPFQQSVLTTTLRGLADNANSLKSLGLMANSTSYPRSEGSSDDTTRFFSACIEKAKAELKDPTGKRLLATQSIEKCRSEGPGRVSN